jgi:hypothetical protein
MKSQKGPGFASRSSNICEDVQRRRAFPTVARASGPPSISLLKQPRSYFPLFLGSLLPRVPYFQGSLLPRFPTSQVPYFPGSLLPRVPTSQGPYFPGSLLPSLDTCVPPRVGSNHD